MCLNTHNVTEMYRFSTEIWINYGSYLLAHILQKHPHKNVK
jgi:hypothetical protein